MVTATSTEFPIDKDRLFVLRALCQLSPSGDITIDVKWLDFMGNPLGKATLYDGTSRSSDYDHFPQWITLQAMPIISAEKAMIIIGVANNANLIFGQPNIC